MPRAGVASNPFNIFLEGGHVGLGEERWLAVPGCILMPSSGFSTGSASSCSLLLQGAGHHCLLAGPGISQQGPLEQKAHARHGPSDTVRQAAALLVSALIGFIFFLSFQKDRFY